MSRLISIFFLVFLCQADLGWCDDRVDFATEIAPIFEAHCLRCHSDADPNGDVSLSRREAIVDGEYVSAGQPQASRLLDVISSGSEMRAEMPQDAAPLSAAQVEIVRAWIEQGAEWPDTLRLSAPQVVDRNWWSLAPIQASQLDAGEQNPIDVLVDAKLQEIGLSPVPAAEPATLIRRLTYDLTGLPPTPAEIDAFVQRAARDAEAAWSELVDRLLASPHFGEKWAQHWLDVARYAETHGYDKDKPRNNAWPYRDYVIDSFNHDKAYSRFVQEQLAGDSLFPDNPQSVLGLGFLAAGPWDFIGHAEVGEGKLDGRIAKHLDRDEMLSAVFNVFMSTTVQCAQCHHHKFDPIRMEDYYRLQAVFAAVDRADRVYDDLPASQRVQKQALKDRLQQLQAEIASLQAKPSQALRSRLIAIDERVRELIEKYGSALDARYGYHSQLSQREDAIKWVQLDFGRESPVHEIRLVAAYDLFANIGAGFGFPKRFYIQVGNDPNFVDASVRTVFDATLEDQENPKSRTLKYRLDESPVRYVRLTATKLAERQADFMLALAELQAFDAGGQNLAQAAQVTALDSIEAPERWSTVHLVDGVVPRLVNDVDGHRELCELELQQLRIESDIYSPELKLKLAGLRQDSQRLEAELAKFPAGKVVYAAATHFPNAGQFVATEGQPRAIRLLQRGDLRFPADEMQPGAPPLWPQVPSVFSLSPDASEDAARQALALYVTAHDNPLVWRTIANRIWQWTFGQPLVGTCNDFGRMGQPPSHPQLLDYLAGRLRDDPRQSLKSLVRVMVTSRAYRRQCAEDLANAALDSDNQFLWRANRRRMTAEEIRDSLLSVAGVLRLDARGGPSFQDFVIEKPEHSPHYEYALHDMDAPASHRRSIYRFIVRSQPQPMLTALDCADPSISVPMRDESTTALQALTQWNNRLVESMSRHFAARLRSEAPEAANARVDYACRLALGRVPDEIERRALCDLLSQYGEETLARVLMNTSAFTYVE